MAQSPDIIMVAAGQSRRMGEVNKLLIPVDGIPLIRRSALLFRSFSSRVTVVVGYQAEKIIPLLADLDVTIIENPDFQKGQQSSVKVGISQFSFLDRTTKGVMIALADQYSLTPEDLTRLYTEFLDQQAGKITIPRVSGQRGNPVIFPAPVISSIQKQKIPSLRDYIDSHPDQIHWVDTSNPHYITDLDTPEDAKKAGLAYPAL